jgi:hypothetical protein
VLLWRAGVDKETLLSRAGDLISKLVKTSSQLEYDPRLLEEVRRTAARRIMSEMKQ